MNKKLEQINNLLEDLKKIDRDKIEAFMSFAMVTEKEDGILSKKQKALINVALSVSAQCEWCIELHVSDAFKAGATENEIIDAGMQAVLMHGGPALMYLIPVAEAIQENKNG
ncbi:MAG: carboxymuconolactone decarboxylase family protein [Chlorobi bacterium]|nr:carboxymuconolactone decarboxylase family protein [Chlorobiota bacterium]